MQNKTISSLALLFIQVFFVLLWSSGFIAIIVGLHYANPFTFLFYRMVFATIFMLMISLLTKAPWPNNWNTVKKTIITGLLTQFLYLSSYFYVLFYGISPTVMSIILALQPLLTAVIYSLILKRKVIRKQYFGLTLGLCGVFITVIYDLSVKAMTVSGFIIAIICLGAITVGSIVQKSNPEMDLRTGSTIQFAVSIIPFTVLSMIFSSFKINLNIEFILALGWIVLIVSVAGNYLYYKLLQGHSAIKINSLFYLMPATTAILSYFVFKQPINMYIVTGIVFIIIGVLITQRSSQTISN